MPYYPKLEILFVHIPKTGGTTISTCLKKNEELITYNPKHIINHFTKKLLLIRTNKLNNYKHSLAENMLLELGSKQKKYTKFTVVRNPWDLVVSFYSYLRRPLDQKTIINDFKITNYLNPVEASINACKMDFKSWVKLYYNPYLRPRQKEETRSPYPVSHFYRQLDWITNTKGEILVDKILKFEDHNEWENFFKGLGLKFTEILNKKFNSSKRDSSYKNYYDEETKSLIGKYYKKDIDHFNYKF